MESTPMIKLDSETEARALASIKRFFDDEMDDDIGDLKARLVLEFCLEEIGPSVYNKAVSDAQSFVQERVTDIDASCYEPEFNYWKK
jgi:uncharacterized protein (DUF2164 family)